MDFDIDVPEKFNPPCASKWPRRGSGFPSNVGALKINITKRLVS